MGEMLREIEAPIDGRFIVRIYIDKGTQWRAWLDFMSLQHADLFRSQIVRTASTRAELVDWAESLDVEELRRALEDAELVSASELGRPPIQAAAG